ncbi:NarK family nitrate/nitrite MFS transporter [Streptomyces sp. NPDC044571]|uniref:NarK family nitrate/nitrite MFS transporter n=1 Tax=Streptomyces sp. NPDC044571 TaxID=3155371 RepID=UPI00340353E9
MAGPAPTPTATPQRLRPHPAESYGPGTSIGEWRPEYPDFWQATGRRVARRNLWVSIPALMLGFVVWQVWSVTVVRLNDVGFGFSKAQLFWLTAIPGLTGGTFRILYTFIGPIVGERKFTALSTIVLVAPMLWLGCALQDTGTPYGELALIAAVCGIGGANFASSMANIGFFFPRREKGTANGLNGGLGNLGVSVVQLVAPLVVTAGVLGPPAGGPQRDAKQGNDIWLQNGAFLWVLPLVVTALLAWFLMNDLTVAAAPFREQKVIFRRKHNWLMTWLYVGTFGSFIGFAAGLPLLIKNDFEVQGHQATTYAWIGPFIGALMRWAGGRLADRIGGARVTMLSFTGMAGALVVVIAALPSGGDRGSFWTFFAGFLAAFAFSGLGNGSTFRQIPVIFRDRHMQEAEGRGAEAQAAALRQSEMEAGAVTGFSSAIAAYGFFFIPAMFAAMPVPHALWLFIGFYATCLALCWWFYAREGAEAPS